VAAQKHETARHGLLGRGGDLHRLRHIGQVVERDAQRLGPERDQLSGQVGGREDLAVQHADVVPGLPGGGRHPLEPQRLQPQENLRIHQATRMNQQQTHDHLG